MSDLRAARREATREQILDVAWAHASEVGISAVSLRELARSIGMRAPSLYTYFSSKHAIYDAMFAQGYEALIAMHEDLDEELVGLGRSEALTRAVERFVAFCQESPARYQLMFTRAVPGWEPAPEAYAVSVESYLRMAQALERYGIAGTERLDLWSAMTAGLAAQQMANEPESDRWRRLSGTVVEMLIKQIDEEERT